MFLCEHLLSLGEPAQHGSLGAEDENCGYNTCIIQPEAGAFSSMERGIGFKPRALNHVSIHD